MAEKIVIAVKKNVGSNAEKAKVISEIVCKYPEVIEGMKLQKQLAVLNKKISTKLADKLNSGYKNTSWFSVRAENKS